VIVTSYTSICPTGFTTITLTYTTTWCPYASATGLATTTAAVPDGWYTTTAVCTPCAATPTTVTLTLPEATLTAAPTQTAIVPTVPAATGSSGQGSGSGSGSGSQPQPVASGPRVVVSSFPTSKALVGGSAGVRLASQTPTFAFHASSTNYAGAASPSATPEGAAPVWTGAASRMGAVDFIGIAFAVFFSAIVLM
jgi:chitinase